MTKAKIQVPGGAPEGDQSSVTTIPDNLQLNDGNVLDAEDIVRALKARGLEPDSWEALTDDERAEHLEAIKRGEFGAVEGDETDTSAAGSGLDWSASGEADAAGAQAVYVEHEAPAEIPDLKDVNPKKITRAVLTKQGWVMPDQPAAKA